MHNVVLTMPVYNEADGIEFFLEEIFLAFSNCIEIVVCDDSSTDNTYTILSAISRTRENLHITRNPKNLGHGPTFLNALKFVQNFIDYQDVITCDGDGQFSGNDIFRLYQEYKRDNVEVLEGVRTIRSDGRLRSIISFCTRTIVGILAGDFPRDANTPLRFYQKNTINLLLESIPQNSLVPNLWFSILVRTLKKDFTQSGAKSRPRIGKIKSGTTWQKMSKSTKMKALIVFCGKATREIFSNFTKIATNKG